jgi:hypothetical protein
LEDAHRIKLENRKLEIDKDIQKDENYLKNDKVFDLKYDISDNVNE